MSSFTVSASGSRGYNLSVSEQATNIGTPSKTGDNASIQIGGAGDISVILPLSARLERILGSDRGDEYIRLVMPGSAMIYLESAQHQWPHVFVTAGKHIHPYYADAEVLEVVHERVGDLIPATE